MASRIRTIIPLLFALAACPPKSGDTTATLGSSSDTGGEPTGTTAMVTGTGTNTTGTPTTGGTLGTSTSGTSGTTGGTTTGGPASVCDPQPADVAAHFTIDGDDSPFDPIQYTDHCTVADITEGDTLMITLSGCKADPGDPIEEPVMHTIEATISPSAPVDLAVGEEVVFTYFVDGPWWFNKAFTLRRPSDELVLAGLRTSEMPGQTYGPPSGFFAPLSLSLHQICDPEPIVDEDPGSGFITDADCYQVRREQVRFGWADGATVELIDRSAQQWPDQPYWVVVGAAEYHVDLGQCSDLAPRSVRVTILRHEP